LSNIQTSNFFSRRSLELCNFSPMPSQLTSQVRPKSGSKEATFASRTVVTRREFLHTVSIAAIGSGFFTGCATCPAPRKLSANDKLNIGVIGTAHRAASNIKGVATENIVALCDVDDTFLAAAKEKHPDAKTYNDFRRLIEQKDIDAIVVASADQTHAVATMAAMKSGRHVYCEKPLTHTVWETRQITNYARRHPKLVTQMGTQIHAGENYRRSVELVWSGAIGEVREVLVWCDKTVSSLSRDTERPTDMPPVPKNVHWDLWLGPAPARPFHSAYHPKNWRRWWDFGEGTLGDMACHYIDLVFWALKLHHPLTIEAEGPPVHPELTPDWITARWQFPARGHLPPVKLTWFDGGKYPDLVTQGKVPNWKNGVLFIGSKGMLLADYEKRMLLPEEKFAGFQAPLPTIPNSIGHHAEWIRACKTGAPTTCNFAYGGALTETVLLGNVAYRTGHKLEWDSAALRVRNSAQAENYLSQEYRRGWSL
jgi:predicted dehydrogenase